MQVPVLCSLLLPQPRVPLTVTQEWVGESRLSCSHLTDTCPSLLHSLARETRWEVLQGWDQDL